MIYTETVYCGGGEHTQTTLRIQSVSGVPKLLVINKVYEGEVVRAGWSNAHLHRDMVKREFQVA